MTTQQDMDSRENWTNGCVPATDRAIQEGYAQRYIWNVHPLWMTSGVNELSHGSSHMG